MDIIINIIALLFYSRVRISLSAVVTGLFKEFTRRKTITFKSEEELTPYAKEQLKKAREDREAGRTSPIFDSADEMIAWLNKQGV